jgi:hypothetical protein
VNTLSEIIAYVLRNKRGYAFKDWPEENIIDYITKSYSLCRIIYSSDDNGHISGISIYDVYNASKTIHVNQILVNSNRDFKAMIRTFFSFFPASEWQLTAIRHGKKELIRYNTEKLKQKLLNMKFNRTFKGMA